MKKITSILLLMFSVLALSGCGTVWVHNSKDESSFYQDKNFCTQESRRVYPDTSNQSTGATTTNCTGYGYSVNCTTAPSYNYSYDTNGISRSLYRNDCMKSKGWRKQSK